MAPLLLTALLVAQAPPAQRLHVEWSAPDGCPARAELTSGLESSVPPDRTFTASVRIDAPGAVGQKWRAVVITTSEDGQHTRVVEAPDCAKVGQAAVLVVTLAATRLKETAAPPAAPVALPPAPARSEQPPVQPEKAPARPGQAWELPSLSVQVLVGGSAGVVPSVDPFLGGALAARVGPLRIELAYTRWLDSEATSALRGARFEPQSLHLLAAWLFQPAPRVELGPCVAAESGLLLGQSVGVSGPSRNTAAWVAVLAGATLGYQFLKGMRAWVSLEGGLNVLHPTFVIDTPTGVLVVHQMGWPAARLALGIELHVP